MSDRLDFSELHSGAMPFQEGDPLYDDYVARLDGGISDRGAREIADRVLAAPREAHRAPSEGGWTERDFPQPGDLPHGARGSIRPGYGDPRR